MALPHEEVQVELPGLDPATAVLWALVGIAAVWDIAQRRIPNPLVLIGLLLGAALQVQAHGLAGLASGLGGVATAFAVLILPFHFRLMGGGDVKLAMVCGVFTGWAGAIQIILFATVIHGILAVGFLAVRLALRSMGRALSDESMVPHAVGFAAATVLFTSGIAALW